jgi:peptidyl-prolyl cis-trans isomerase SurA
MPNAKSTPDRTRLTGRSAATSPLPDLRRSGRAGGWRRAALALAVAAGLATAGLAQAQTGASRNSRNGDFIVAVVNTELVTAVEVAQRLERAAAEARRAGAMPAADTLRQQVLDGLIDERVQITYARETGQKVDDAEIDRAVANVAAQNQMTLVQLRDRLRSEGMDMARLRANLRDQLLLERVREREVMQRIRITDADIDSLLDEQRAKTSAQVQLNLAQILVTLPEGADASVQAERQARAEQALARVRGGEDFTTVARELSEDGNRAAGGEIGLRPVDRLPDLFVEGVRDLAVGQVTPRLLRSQAGFHILKVVDRQQANAFKVTQTRARHILLRLSERAQAEAVVRRMDGIRQQIERGDKRFEDVAREISEDGSAPGGGDLGWASPGQYVPEFEEAMNKLAPGGLSGPVVSRFGVHLIQVLERREASIDPKEVREQARNQLRESRFDQAYADWAKDLRLRAYIEMREPPQ